ncbi:SDR family oxidoreductase [Pseudonocardia sp. HH130630-07]|uniref:SDR family oxidoreductase n=1 Tax=Pseudonocardia sp. HH130630-07 TaxID=1690815 RepID=UPI000814FF54|nr:SDR family oxidoreductase [Pseudonocardia sp. HH130630-07]ANY08852.1 NAD(P)-dependent oxidoreductase [Pseudonocardia sp. HH130630-07]
MSIAVSGASGALGRATAELLLDRVDPGELVLTTRRPEALADLAGRGARVRAADFDDPASLVEALHGVEKLLLVSTDAVGRRVPQHRAAIEAAERAGVGHVVYTSVPSPGPDNPALVVPDHLGTEAALRESSVAWTFLRNNLYSHLQEPTVAAAARTGRLTTNGGTGGAAYVDRRDCAAVAAAVLTQDGHEGRAYDVTGPDAVTAADLARIAGEIAGSEVSVADLDDAAFERHLLAAGLPEVLAQLTVSFGAATRLGYLGTVTDTVQRLTGVAPRAAGDLLRAATVS